MAVTIMRDGNLRQSFSQSTSARVLLDMHYKNVHLPGLLTNVRTMSYRLTHHRLEAGMKCHEEWWFVAQSQNPLFHQHTVNVIILYDDFLLEDFDGIQLIRSLTLGKHHLPANHITNTSIHSWPLSHSVNQKITSTQMNSVVYKLRNKT